MAQFLFRFDRSFFWPAAGLTPETYYFVTLVTRLFCALHGDGPNLCLL
jgi:hypothetical protein